MDSIKVLIQFLKNKNYFTNYITNLLRFLKNCTELFS